MIFECLSTVLQGWRARLGGPFFLNVLSFGLAGPPWRAFRKFCSRARLGGPFWSFALSMIVCFYFFELAGPPWLWLLLLLRESFEVGGPALAGRPDSFCNALVLCVEFFSGMIVIIFSCL